MARKKKVKRKVMGKHTPGPWRKPHANEDYSGACVVRKDGYIVADCNVFGGNGSPSAQECEANARLIRSAPDLLAACERFAFEMDNNPYGCLACGASVPTDKTDAAEAGCKHDFIKHVDGCWIAQTRAAITKATGAAP